jgi:hypothetical protein
MVGACGIAGSDDHGVPATATNGPAGRAAWDWGGVFLENKWQAEGGLRAHFLQIVPTSLPNLWIKI